MKTNLHKSYATDADIEKEGIWVNVGDGVEFKVKRFGGANTGLKKVLAKRYKPFAKLAEKGLLPEDKEKEIYVTSFVEACLCDWRGLQDEEGNDIPFSSDDAKKILIELPDLLDIVMTQAQDAENFKGIEEVGKF